MSVIVWEYGFEVNSEVDECYYYEKVIEAVCKVLKQYYCSFGIWIMAVVVYNVGYGNIKDEIEIQWVEIYYDFNFNVEIVCYIFCFVAIKEIFSCLDEFGFYLEDEDGYLFLDNYEVVKVI